ncbi:MAG: TetR/AcrR family transcriptional regulator [Caldimonas sp.]
MSTARPVPAKKKRQVKQNVERREASTELLLGAALRLFVSQGFRATNLEQISAAAGLTKGAVYFYFGSKEAVLLEVLKRVRAVVVDRALEAVEAAGDGPVRRLVAYIHYQAGLGITHRDEVLLLILMSLEYKERPGEVNDFIASLYRKQRRLIETLVAEGQKHGSIRSDVPARELAAIILATHDGTFLEWFRRSSTLRGRELTRALRVVLLGGAALPAKPAG